MKILFSIKALDDIQGGAERVLADISSGLADKGHDVSVLSFDVPGGQAFYPLNEQVKRIALGIGDAKSKARLGEVMKRMIALRGAVKEQKPDVVVAFMHSTFIPASFALIGTGVPLIASEHIVPDHYKDRRLEFMLLGLCRFFVHKMTVLSDTIVQSYPRALRAKMVAIANPVHPAKKPASPAGERAQEKIILNVGRLTVQKDQETLIRAFASLAKDYPDWHLRIIGEGSLRAELEATIDELGMQERISLPGITAEIEEEYCAAHIFALPSLYESFGLVTAEAMAHGLPAIGFADCPGTNALIVHEQNGLLVGEGDRVEIFAQGLKRLMDDASLREKMGREGVKTVEQYHPEVIVDQWEALISEIAQERAR